ncbi:MAG: hypothetical protein KY475_21710, partial [Planctomycetes bacterium]|nr:hypothetical protein [Planctomycetota bacterium]
MGISSRRACGLILALLLPPAVGAQERDSVAQPAPRVGAQDGDVRPALDDAGEAVPPPPLAEVHSSIPSAILGEDGAVRGVVGAIDPDTGAINGIPGALVT